jgi:hypothetical protein
MTRRFYYPTCDQRHTKFYHMEFDCVRDGRLDATRIHAAALNGHWKSG